MLSVGTRFLTLCVEQCGHTTQSVEAGVPTETVGTSEMIGRVEASERTDITELTAEDLRLFYDLMTSTGLSLLNIVIVPIS